jgi:hypothetical protein
MTILVQHTLTVPSGGTSQKLTLTAGAASPSAVINATHCVFYSTVDCFIRQGASGATTAVADGTDHFLPGGVPVRLDITSGNVLSVISASAGTVYITRNA